MRSCSERSLMPTPTPTQSWDKRKVAQNIIITDMLTDLSRYRPPTSHVQAWYDEVKDYSFPYPQECNPYCPLKCSGPVCTHYTQVGQLLYGSWLLEMLHMCNETVCLSHLVSPLCCPCFVAGLGYQQSNWLRSQLVLQHERVGADLGQSRLSCLQLFTQVSTNVAWWVTVVSSHFDCEYHRKCFRLHLKLKRYWSPVFSSFFARYVTCSGETGGAMHLTNTGPHALLVLPAMEEDARTTSATKVRISQRENEKNWWKKSRFLFSVLSRRWQFLSKARGNWREQLHWTRGLPYHKSPAPGLQTWASQFPCPGPHTAPHRGPAEEWNGQHAADV